MMRKKVNNFFYVEDFAADEEFKKWVLNSDQQLDLFWKNYMVGHPELISTIKKARELIQLINFPKCENDPNEKDERLNQVIAGNRSSHNFTILFASKSKLRESIDFNYWVKVAAVIAFILSGTFFYLKLISIDITEESPLTDIEMIEKTNGNGQKMTLRLPDGTQVTLNSASSITYPSQFDHKQRLVKLSGEAYFEVAKDLLRPFVVETGKIQTVALGTSFNLNSFPENRFISVSLLSGRVEVSFNTKSGKIDKVTLNPQEKVKINKNTLVTEKNTFNTEIETGWKDGVLIFDGDSYAEVVKKLERWYGIKVKTQRQPNNNWQIRGRFENLSLEQLLENLKFTHNIDFTMDGKDITIRF